MCRPYWPAVCVSRRVHECCVWSSSGIYNQQMSACPLPPWGRLLLFQSVSVCEGVVGGDREWQGCWRLLQLGAQAEKTTEPTTDRILLPQHTHGQEMHQSHKLCPDDQAPWVKFTTYRNMQRQTVDNNKSQRSGSQQQNNCSKLTFAGSETASRPGLTDPILGPT